MLSIIDRFKKLNSTGPVEGNKVSAVALLIDGDNVPADFAVDYLAYAGKFGGVTVRRVYANWSSPTIGIWKEASEYYGFTKAHQSLPVSGKNATDIALVIDAMELHQQGMMCFCIVGGDSDYTPLVYWLIEHGCMVSVLGKANTSLILQHSCTCYMSIDALLPDYRYRRQLFVGELPSDVITEKEASLENVFMQAYKAAQEETKEVWITLILMGKYIRQIDPHFACKLYGFSTMKALVKKKFPAFQIKESGNGQASIRLWELE